MITSLVTGCSSRLRFILAGDVFIIGLTAAWLLLLQGGFALLIAAGAMAAYDTCILNGPSSKSTTIFLKTCMVDTQGLLPHELLMGVLQGDIGYQMAGEQAREVGGAGSLGVAPWSCPSSSRAASTPFTGPAIGASPAWVGPITPATSGMTIHTGNPRYTDHTRFGWTRKILWAIKPGYKHRITLRGGTLAGSTPLWFQIGRYAPTMLPALDPAHPGVPLDSTNGWATYPSYLFIPASGCYFLEAHWPGGMWRRTFAAGR